MRKKMMAMAAVTAMMVSAGTGSVTMAAQENDDPSKWPVVKMEVVSSTGEEAKEQEIEDALNEYLVSIDAGVQADLVPLAFGDRATQLTLLLTDSENGIDLFCWRFYSSVTDMVNNDQVIALDDYRDQYPELWEMFPESVYKTCQVNGKQYSMPAADSFGNFQVYTMRKDIAEEIGVMDLVGKKITEEQFEDILAKAEAAHPELCWLTDPTVTSYQGIDNLGFSDWIGVLLNQGIDQDTIVNYYETDEFRAYCEKCKMWADNGYYIDDPLNNTGMMASYVPDGIAGGGMLEAYSVDYAAALMSAQIKNYEMVIFQLNDFVGTNSTVYNGWNISSTCQNPDAAMKLLDLLYTDEKVARFLALGIEGETYELDENGCAWYPEGVDSSNVGWNLDCPWFYPNECLGAPFNTTLKTYFTDMIACWTNPENKYSKAMGFVFDPANVYDQYAACSATVAEYRDALLYGQVDVDSAMEKFNEELKENGIDEIIEEMQKQYDEFLGK